MSPNPLDVVYRYHDGTKHHFHAFARSLGYLDWASQPTPFRTYQGAPLLPLFPASTVLAPAYVPKPLRFDDLLTVPVDPVPLSAAAVADVLRHALGLSAWKVYGQSRWALRVNPSSGNLHPTEAYIVCGPLPGLSGAPAVYHYAPDHHALEQRCTFDGDAWRIWSHGEENRLLIVLTSIHWREAWKYGERAFRYCQHDLGHAVAAVAIAGRLCGWHVRLLDDLSSADVATLSGIDRDEDFIDAEREEPACALMIGSGAAGDSPGRTARTIVESVRRGEWKGRASRLSEDHVQWTFIDEIASATRAARGAEGRVEGPRATAPRSNGFSTLDARQILLQRRSALAFDGTSTCSRESFARMLAAVMPGSGPPWSSLWWSPRIHLLLFVHRVDSLPPGLYLLARDSGAVQGLRAACGRELLWEEVEVGPTIVCLARGDCRGLARRLSCDQDIASDGFFSLGMIADFESSLEQFGPSFYRNLFWESGVVGQVLYLEAEVAGARATGIGCFYDDPVHDVLGLQGHAFQSLYHFTVGMPVEDTRLTTQPGYSWELPLAAGT